MDVELKPQEHLKWDMDLEDYYRIKGSRWMSLQKQQIWIKMDGKMEAPCHTGCLLKCHLL